MKETKDYSIFKSHESNRPVCPKHVEKIMKSIEMRNMLSFRPILVNEDMEVIDGQHRLQAAKNLGLPIFYEIKENLKTKDMLILNDNTKIWKRDDYLNYYVKEGLDEYIKMKNFMKENNLSLPLALILLGVDGGKKVDQHSSPTDSFKSGRFTFPEIDREDVKTKIFQAEEIVYFVFPRMVGLKNFVKGPKFRKAVFKFLCSYGVEFSVFMNKLHQKIEWVKSCSTLGEYMRLFKSIYNFNNRNPIQFENMED